MLPAVFGQLRVELRFGLDLDAVVLKAPPHMTVLEPSKAQQNCRKPANCEIGILFDPESPRSIWALTPASCLVNRIFLVC